MALLLSPTWIRFERRCLQSALRVPDDRRYTSLLWSSISSQTKGPLQHDPAPAFTVTKLAQPDGSYEITFGGGM